MFTYRGRESLFLFLLNSQLWAPPAFVHFDRVSGRNDNEVIRWDIAGLLSILDTKKKFDEKQNKSMGERIMGNWSNVASRLLPDYRSTVQIIHHESQLSLSDGSPYKIWTLMILPASFHNKYFHQHVHVIVPQVFSWTTSNVSLIIRNVHFLIFLLGKIYVQVYLRLSRLVPRFHDVVVVS